MNYKPNIEYVNDISSYRQCAPLACIHQRLKKYNEDYNICIDCHKKICIHNPKYRHLYDPSGSIAFVGYVKYEQCSLCGTYWKLGY